MTPQKSFLSSAVWPVILFVVFAGVYAALFYSQRAALIESFDYHVSRIPSIVLYGSDMAATLKGYSVSYGGLVGAGFGLAYLVVAYVFFGLFSLLRLTQMRFGAMLAFLLALIPFDVLAYVMYSEPLPRTAISTAVDSFVRLPFWYASLAATSLAAILFIVSCAYAKPSSVSKA